MKKYLTCICLVLMLVLTLCPTQVGASGGILPEIVEEPQNLVYPVGSVAIYSVKTAEPVDSCTWFLEYSDVTYDLSKADGSQPWEAFVTGGSGASQDGNTYRYFFEGIEEDLAGAHIYAVLKKGNSEVTSQKAMIQLGGTAMPPSIHVPDHATIYVGEELGLLCAATAPNGGLLSYTWYETSTGKLQDIVAIDRGNAKDPTLYVDTSEPGTRYYVCMVETEQEGVGYSSVIPVQVVENSAAPTEVPTQTPTCGGVQTISPTESVEPTAKDSGFPWWIIPLLMVAMAVGAVIAFFVTKELMKK